MPNNLFNFSIITIFAENKLISILHMELRTNSYLQNGKYRIIVILGQGGFGITYLAEQVALERKVAIKEFFLKDFCDRAADGTNVTLGTQSNKEMMERYLAKFKKEAKIISKFNHPNVIRVHDVFDENNTSYYVMEYLEGESLSALVAKNGAFSENVAIHYITCIGNALEYIHSFGVNHLDVKPSNSMVRSNGEPVLIDFGVSKQYDSGGQQTSSTPVGISEGYAPSEQYKKGGVSEFSPQTDIYSLGATLYHLVTGQVPPSAFDILNEGLPPLPVYLSNGVKTAIIQSRQPKKRDRPSNISQFLTIIQNGSSGTTSGVGYEYSERTQYVSGETRRVSDIEKTAFVSPVNPPRQPEVNSSSDDEGSTGAILWAIGVIFAIIILILLASRCGRNNKPADVYADSCATDTCAIVADTAYYEGYYDEYGADTVVAW